MSPPIPEPRHPSWARRARIRPRIRGPALVLAVALLPAGALAQDAGDEEVSPDGIYTEEQAERGAEIYEEECGACHFHDEFRGPVWDAQWRGQPVGRFLESIRTTMPADRPGSLSRQEYADVVAYILELNDFPPGGTELPSDPDELADIVIDARRR